MIDGLYDYLPYIVTLSVDHVRMAGRVMMIKPLRNPKLAGCIKKTADGSTFTLWKGKVKNDEEPVG